jgi:hypothetical protein
VVEKRRADGVEVANGDRDKCVDDFASNLASFAHGSASSSEKNHSEKLDGGDDVGGLEAEAVLFHVERDGRRVLEALW